MTREKNTVLSAEEDKLILNVAEGKHSPGPASTKVNTPAELLTGKIKSSHSEWSHVILCGLYSRSTYSLPGALISAFVSELNWM